MTYLHIWYHLKTWYSIQKNNKIYDTISVCILKKKIQYYKQWKVIEQNIWVASISLKLSQAWKLKADLGLKNRQERILVSWTGRGESGIEIESEI